MGGQVGHMSKQVQQVLGAKVTLYMGFCTVYVGPQTCPYNWYS